MTLPHPGTVLRRRARPGPRPSLVPAAVLPTVPGRVLPRAIADEPTAYGR